MFTTEDDRTSQGIAHLVVTFDPGRFDIHGGQDAAARLDLLATKVLESGGRLPGSARRLPSEIADDELLDFGDELTSELRDWCNRLCVDWPMASGR
jgi:hypothetical protein